MSERATSPEEAAPEARFRARHALLKRLADVVCLLASRINAFERAVTGDPLAEILRLIAPEVLRRVAFRMSALDENAGKTIVAIIPSFAERYLSTALFEGL